jgi:hypothetical protein
MLTAALPRRLSTTLALNFATHGVSLEVLSYALLNLIPIFPSLLSW